MHLVGKDAVVSRRFSFLPAVPFPGFLEHRPGPAVATRQSTTLLRKPHLTIPCSSPHFQSLCSSTMTWHFLVCVCVCLLFISPHQKISFTRARTLCVFSPSGRPRSRVVLGTRYVHNWCWVDEWEQLCAGSALVSVRSKSTGPGGWAIKKTDTIGTFLVHLHPRYSQPQTKERWWMMSN